MNTLAGALMTEAETAAVDTLNLAKNLVSELSKAERTIACEVKEVAASPSANETLLVVIEAEVVEKDKEVDEDLLLLLASQTTALSAIVGSETDKSPPSAAALFVSFLTGAQKAGFFLGILTAFDGIMIKCLGSGEGTRQTFAGRRRRQQVFGSNDIESHDARVRLMPHRYGLHCSR